MSGFGLSEEQFADVVTQAIKLATAPLVKRLADVERKAADLEARRGLLYRGTWSADDAPYGAGDVATSSGSMWIATVTTRARPSESPDWRLCVKAGRDGKDAR